MDIKKKGNNSNKKNEDASYTHPVKGKTVAGKSFWTAVLLQSLAGE
jgi:DNA helicase HerA-like ATPase